MAKTGAISQDKILEVAEAIIALKGIKNTSLADIAKAGNISKGTLYYYYASKESLVYDLASRHFDRISRKMTKWIDDIKGKVDPEDLLRIVLENSIEELQFDRIHLYLIQEIITGNEELKVNFIDRYKEWEGMFTKALSTIIPMTWTRHQMRNELLESVMPV